MTPAYDRDLIARMLEASARQGSTPFTTAAIEKQARLLREADNAEAASVGTAAASEDGVPFNFDDGGPYNGIDWQATCEALQAEVAELRRRLAASGQGVECEHKRTEPRRTHVRCLDCESIMTDSDASWGAARNRWFPSLPAARAAAAPTQEKGNG